MKVKELISVTFDKVTIYKANNRDFEDIYKGTTNDIPADILEMKVKVIGATKKAVIDIQVF
ncbi:hypothetical protein [Clostridium sulfidigenes]|uniref:hypothetical protein n=1 Tax=Clostridium sulfidigenes TaxID=318464 RepID=UPI003F8C8366